MADRDVDKEPEGVAYELIAESCIPGIETADWINIFEEQTVHRTVVLAAAGLPTSVFAEDEKLTFGGHMAGAVSRLQADQPFKCRAPSASTSPRARPRARPRPRTAAAASCPSTSSRRSW